jgi:hypothetical protein
MERSIARSVTKPSFFEPAFRLIIEVVTMTPAASASFVSAELSEFLYAPIGSENNGMTLSVLSALTRLNIDPWDEAAQLCELPKHAAATRLCSLIARLPAGSWTHTDCQAIAEHLIEFLPHGSSSQTHQDHGGSTSARSRS